MTTKVTPTILVENTKKVIIHFLIESDGMDGELVNQVVFDPQNNPEPIVYNDATNPDGTPVVYPQTILKFPTDPQTQWTIRQLWHSCAWFDIAIQFNAAQPLTTWVVCRDTDGYNDFRYFGGLKDRSTADHDQKVLFTTNGLDGSASSKGAIVIEFGRD